MAETTSLARPFLKWAGGKSQIISQLHKRLPVRFNQYWEPFVGGGALFFSLTSLKAHLFDVNEELINAYKFVRDDVEGLICELEQHRYEKEYFYSVRDWDRSSLYREMPAIKRAGRFIYLNKTCFNGLHRVNSKGHFNVPFGSYVNPKIIDVSNLRRCSQVLQNCELQAGEYSLVEVHAQKGDFIYFDPPYVPLSSTSSFTAYAKNGFSLQDQVALRDLCVRLAHKGVLFMLSNSANEITKELYSGFNLESVNVGRSINSKGSRRGDVEEIIVTNY